MFKKGKQTFIIPDKMPKKLFYVDDGEDKTLDRLLAVLEKAEKDKKNIEKKDK